MLHSLPYLEFLMKIQGVFLKRLKHTKEHKVHFFFITFLFDVARE